MRVVRSAVALRPLPAARRGDASVVLVTATVAGAATRTRDVAVAVRAVRATAPKPAPCPMLPAPWQPFGLIVVTNMINATQGWHSGPPHTPPHQPILLHPLPHTHAVGALSIMAAVKSYAAAPLSLRAVQPHLRWTKMYLPPPVPMPPSVVCCSIFARSL